MNQPVRSVNEFYNSVAPSYNAHMTDADKKAREAVHDLFARYITRGNVLDFGGGTGLDLPWLLEKNYHVFFVEPSTNMRSVARATASKGDINFIESNTDFTEWSANNLPFQPKVDGILANFAVLNCIENIDRLFEKFALVSSAGCHIVATVIDPRFMSMMKYNSVLSAIRMSLQSKMTIHNKYDNQYHATYIHSLRSIRRASQDFDLVSVTSLDFSSFAVLIFKRR